MTITRNENPVKVVITDEKGPTANNHPLKVQIEGGGDFATKEDIQELDTKIEALATDLSYKGSVSTYDNLPSDAQTGDVYTTVDTGILYVWDGNEWVALNEQGVSVITGEGAPTSATEGELGQTYLDTLNGDIYTLTEIIEESGASDTYVWEKIVKESEACPIKVSTADYDTTIEEVPALALYNLAPGLYITTEEMVVTSGTAGGGTINLNAGTLIVISWYSGDSEQYLVQIGKRVFLTQRNHGGYGALPMTTDTRYFLTGNDVVNNIGGTTGPHIPISTRAVSDWKKEVDRTILRHTTAPSSTTYGVLGEIWTNNTTGDIYVLSGVDSADPQNPVYDWEKVAVGASGGGDQADWNTLDISVGSYIKNKPMENSLAYFTCQDGAYPDFGQPTGKTNVGEIVPIADLAALRQRLTYRGVTPPADPYPQAGRINMSSWSDDWEYFGGFSTDYCGAYRWSGFSAYEIANGIVPVYWYGYNGSSTPTYDGQATVQSSHFKEITLDSGEKAILCSFEIPEKYNSGTTYTRMVLVLDDVILADRALEAGSILPYDGDMFISISQPTGKLRTLDQTMLPKATDTTEGITSLQTVTDTVSDSITVGSYLKKTTVANKPQLDIRQAFIDWDNSDATSPAFILNKPFSSSPAGQSIVLSGIRTDRLYGNPSGNDYGLSSAIFDGYGFTKPFAEALGFSLGQWDYSMNVGETYSVGNTRNHYCTYFPTGNADGDKMWRNIVSGAPVNINYSGDVMGMMGDDHFDLSETNAVFNHNTTVDGHTYYAYVNQRNVSFGGEGHIIYGLLVAPLLDTSDVEQGWVLIPLVGSLNNSSNFTVSNLQYTTALPDVKYIDPQVIPLDPSVFEINQAGQITLKTNP